VRLISPFHFTPAAVRGAAHLISAHAVPLERLISHVYSLDDVATAFAKLDAGDGIKALIQP
jgi:Zn-dependent alcohol dehydrogenase